jgi:polysaccharide biosynthesis protein VpsM
MKLINSMSITKRRVASALVLASLTISASHFSVHAQTGAVQPAYKIPDGSKDEDKDGPRGIALAEGVALFPYLNFSLGRDSNLFLTNTNRRSSTIAVYNPGLKLEVVSQSTKFGFLFDSKLGKYAQSSADNYADYQALGTSEFVFSSSMGLKLALDYTKGHDPRGSNDRGISVEPDEFRTTGPSALFAYGANEAIGRVEVELGTIDRRYQNNRVNTIGSDRITDNFAGRFFMRVAPKTSFLVEAREDRFDYKLASSQQDSKERRYLVGVTWDATAATSGTVKLGQIRKNFAASTRKDFSGTGWEANIAWKPLSYSKVDFFTNKSFSESTGLGDFTLVKKFGFAWQHGWNSRLTSVASFTRADDDFVNNVRADRTNSLGLKVNYKLMRWLDIGGEVTNTSRDSNVNGFNYKKNLYMLTFGATL